jgi:DNA-binding response OmpR family regulator
MTRSAVMPPIKLLLVDDEEGFVNVLTKRLSLRGIQATVALSGTESIQLLSETAFDVVVLDLKMRDLDGIEVLRIIKKQYPGIAVIMLTGHGSEIAATEGIKAGAFDYLTKPCDIEELINKISAAAKEKDSADG